MHFKYCVAYIIRELIAQELNKSVCNIISEDFIIYARMLSSTRGSLHNVVYQIFDILFQNPPSCEELTEFVGCWIRKVDPIILVSMKMTHIFFCTLVVG